MCISSDHGPWPVEEIPERDDLFYRVDRDAFPQDDLSIHTGVFRENRGSMSTDWEKYSTPEMTRARTGKAASFGVIRMNVGKVRSIAELSVKHDPDFPKNNQAHTSVFGLGPQGKLPPDQKQKRTALRLALFELFDTWEIPPDAPVTFEFSL